MKISNKPELQKIAFIRSSGIDLRDFMYPYKKRNFKSIFFFSD